MDTAYAPFLQERYHGLIRFKYPHTCLFAANFLHRCIVDIFKVLRRKAAQKINPVSPLTDAQLSGLKKRAKIAFRERVGYYAPLVGVSYGQITIRSQKTRWGSCSSKGNLNFNCLLLLAPPEVLDYVVVHELCHRKEMNHSPRFWAEVARVMPDYKVRRKWLKDNGNGLMQLLK